MNNVDKIAKLFKNTTQEPLILKPGQSEIFKAVVTKKHKRNAIRCYTRYGKSMTVALGALVRVVLYPETWTIIAPTKEKTEIIMRQVIQHMFDHHFFYSQLEVDVALERLKRERKRDYLTFRRGGRIFTLTADARNRKRIGGSLIGEGAGNVILDESPLIPDDIFAFVLRMLGDTADNFLVEIGNAFERNHFKRAFSDSRYNKIIVDCYRGLKESEVLPYNEGKLTQEFLDEARSYPFYEQLYECKFPAANLIDERGYTLLLTEEKIKEAMEREVEPKGNSKLGVDIGRGGDYTVFVERRDNYARMLEKNRDPDLMAQVGRVKKYKEDLKIENPADIFIDDIGIGGGVTDKLREDDIPVTAVVAGAKAMDDSKFTNVKAEAFWATKLWIEAKSNALENQPEFKQLEEIRYKEDSERRLKIEPKQELRQRIGYSPDVADAFMVTFAPQETVPEVFVL